jgi:hypothetical protein
MKKKEKLQDQDNPGNIGITSTSTSANEVWMVVRKKKKSHATSQPMVTRSQALQVSQKGELFPNRLI